MIDFLKKHLVHFIALGVFFVLTYGYFQPQFHGYRLKQHDITQYKGMANETVQFREMYGEEPLWTNSMFGGMPTYQISVDYSGNWIKKSISVMRLWMQSPAGYFFIYLIGFYILLMCWKVDPRVAIVGSIAFAFSTYFIIILQAGHNTKSLAIGLIAPVIGAFYLTYRRQLKWGILLSALFMGMQLAANHVQITYYSGIVLLALGLNELIRAIKEKTMPQFGIATIGILVAYGFALSINFGNIKLTNDYAKHTIRGGNAVTIQPDGTENIEIQTSGLDKDYINQWSYGITESFTLLSPYVKGGGSGYIKDSPFADKLKSPELRSDARIIADNNAYWGDQPIVSGPVYLGVTVLLLAILGLVFLQGTMKYLLFGGAILALLLSWGKNFEGFTDLFIDYVPGYNKFRAVTIILAIVELIIPLIGFLFVHELIKNKDKIKERIKTFYITTGSFAGLLLILTFVGLGDGYLSEGEREGIFNYEERIRAQIKQEDPDAFMAQYQIDIRNDRELEELVARQSKIVNDQFDAVIEFRSQVYRDSMLRSLLFTILAAGLLFVFINYQFNVNYFLASLAILIGIDLIPVNLNYLNNSKKGRDYAYWMEKDKFNFPLSPTKADMDIFEQEVASRPTLQDELKKLDASFTKDRTIKVSENEKWSKRFQLLNFHSNYRVFEPSGGFSSSRASYFHKSIGGYHGAKLRRIQNLYEFHISESNLDVLNMLNVKYILQGNQVQELPSAMGNAWLVKNISLKASENDEIRALGTSYRIAVHGDASILVNGEKMKESIVFGAETLELEEGRNLEPLDLERVTRSGIASVYVSDVQGVRNWIPTRELTKDTLNSFEKIVSVEVEEEFNPSTTAIISEEQANELSSLTFSGEGRVEMLEYRPNYLKYEANVRGDQFVVFSEMYYSDGWNAYIDGKQVPIHRVNYLLRGLEIPDGNHTVEMKFEVPFYSTANNIALAGSLLLFLVIAGAFAKDFILNRKQE